MKRLLILTAIILSILALVFTAFVSFDLQQINAEAFPILNAVSKTKPSFDVRYQLNFTATSAIIGALLVSNGLLILHYFLRNMELNKFNVQQAVVETQAIDENLFKEVEPDTVVELRNAISRYTPVANAENYWQDVLMFLCQQLQAVQGKVYEVQGKTLSLSGTYAVSLDLGDTNSFQLGDGFVGECARLKRTFNLDDIPEGYIKIVSGLGNSYPTHLLLIPAVSNNQVTAVVEMAFFITQHPGAVQAVENFLQEQSSLFQSNHAEKEL